MIECRYAILTKETWPRWQGDVKKGIQHLMKAADINDGQWQIGKTKLFIKDPESVRCFKFEFFDDFCKSILNIDFCVNQGIFRLFLTINDKYLLTILLIILYNNYLLAFLIGRTSRKKVQSLCKGHSNLLSSNQCHKTLFEIKRNRFGFSK